MKVENAVYPTPERIEALLTELTNASTEPVVMLNLLKFRDQAVYSDGRTTTMSGRDAYAIYATTMRRLVEEHGGKALSVHEIGPLMIGEVDDLWDVCALFEYPDITTFATIVNSPEFNEIGVHRDAGLQGQLLIRLSPLPW